MDRNRKLYFVSLGLTILMAALIFAAMYSGFIERSYWLVVLALAIGVVGLGVDLWRRTTPGVLKPLIDTRKHPVVAAVLFIGAMLGLGYLAVHDAFFAPRSYAGHQRSPIFILSALMAYNLLVFFVRYLRSRKHKTSIC